jgi:16S rRNA (guanine(966)-N(2))-methyltransferase RsmD
LGLTQVLGFGDNVGMQKKKPQQVRIIGGAWKRTPLPVLDALGLRPTPDRVRETVFNWINHLRDDDWSQTRVLDLFAGSGGLGFEAASRGAASVTMIDANTAVVRQLESIKDKLKAENVRIMRGDAVASAQSLAGRGEKFDLIFLDPPYSLDLLSRTLPLCLQLVKEGGLVYVESDQPVVAPEGWELVREDKAGMVYYHLLRASA